MYYINVYYWKKHERYIWSQDLSALFITTGCESTLIPKEKFNLEKEYYEKEKLGGINLSKYWSIL